MRLSTSPELIPVTIDCRTCSGVVVGMAVPTPFGIQQCEAKATIPTTTAYGKIGNTHMSREKRRYELRKRAEQMAETRRRLTEAAIELHGSLGPSRTTLSAVAERAGVERRTLYRHFATEADLFAACSTHYFAANPWPDLAAWSAIGDPHERLERALDELYAYYERTEPMFANVLRDAEFVDFARDAVAPLRDYLDEAAEALLAGRRARGRRRRLIEAAIRQDRKSVV